MKVTRVPDRGLAKVPGHYYIEPVLEQLNYWGVCTDNDRMLMAAHVIKELLKIIESPTTKWVAVNSMTDAPDHDCLVAYTMLDQWAAGDTMDDLENLGSGVGYLTWSTDRTWWSIIDDGEVVEPTNVASLCEIPVPAKGTVVGRGAKRRA